MTTDGDLPNILRRVRQHKQEGNKLFKQGNITEAISMYQLALNEIKIDQTIIDEAMNNDKHELIINIHNNLSLMYIKQQQWNEAILYATKVLEKEPSNLKALIRRGRAYLEQGILSESKKDLKEALILDQNNSYITKLITICKQREEMQSNDCYESCGKQGIEKCVYFKRLMDVIDIYHKEEKGNDEVSIDNINISEALDDYIHILYQHDTDEEFAYIASKLGCCNVIKCNDFRRIHRDRSKDMDNKQEFNLNREILQKIHCYFMHSYDIGYRLAMDEKIFCQDSKINNDDDLMHNSYISDKFLNMKQVILSKRKLCDQVISNINHRAHIKCNQITSIESKQKMFHFGYGLNYGVNGEYEDARFEKEQKVSPKYKSLKEELISNDIAVLTIEQFDAECNKALLHFQSLHCKQSLVPYKQNRTNAEDNKISIFTLSIDNILALMIYCNYTNLQYQLSKTYRIGQNYIWTEYQEHQGYKTIKNDTTEHEQFFHLGKNLKIAVHKFGKSLENSTSKKFYHGMSETLQFPESMTYQRSVDIYCPLSTTSCIAVATNFASSGDDGMIIEFRATARFTKFFSVEWISDYPGEKEYLFIQHAPLEIINILQVANGYEYDMILNALKTINEIIRRNEFQRIMTIESDIETLIKYIIQYQLSKTDTSYKPINCSFTKYADEMIRLYFENKRWGLDFNYSMMKNSNWSLLFDEFCHTKYDWIKMKKIVKLFANFDNITVYEIALNESIFEDILRDLRDENVKAKVTSISIKEFNGKSSSWKDNEYVMQFEQIGYRLSGGTLGFDHLTHKEKNWITIEKIDGNIEEFLKNQNMNI